MIVDEDEDYTTAVERARRRRWLFRAVAVLASAAVLWLSARPVLREVKRWQARRLASAAAQALANGQLPEAARQAGDAARLSWSEPEPRRLLALVTASLGQPAEARRFWLGLRQDGHAPSSSDRVALAAALFALGDADGARTELQAATPPENGAPPALLLRAEMALAEGRGEEAEEVARAVLGAASSTDRERYRAAALLAETGSEAAWRRALAEMAELTGSGRPISLEAAVWQARHPRARFDPERTSDRTLLSIVESAGASSTGLALASAELELRLRPEAREAVLSRLLARCAEIDSADRLQLAHWLLRQRDFLRALAVLDPRAVRGRSDLLEARLHALLSAGQWGLAGEELRVSRLDLEACAREQFLARIAHFEGEPARAETHWQQARQAAATNPGRLLQVAHQAEEAGAAAQAEAAFRLAAESAPGSWIVQEECAQFYLRQRRAARLAKLLAQMRQRWPGDERLAARASYFAALAGESSDEPKAIQPPKAPSEWYYRAGLALRLLRRGEAAKSLAVLPTGQPDELGEPPQVQVIRAAALRKAGFVEEAQAVVSRIRRGELQFPEERALLDAALGHGNS